MPAQDSRQEEYGDRMHHISQEGTMSGMPTGVSTDIDAWPPANPNDEQEENQDDDDDEWEGPDEDEEDEIDILRPWDTPVPITTSYYLSLLTPLSPQTTLSTSTYSDSNKPHPGYTESRDAASSSLPDQTELPSPTDDSNGYSQEPNEGKESDAPLVLAAFAVLPVVIIAMLVVVFCCLRKRQRQKKQVIASQEGAQEMKTRDELSVHTYMVPPAPCYPSPVNHVLPPRASVPPQPVILGPIAAGSNGTYMTGMDTSSMVSIEIEHHARNDLMGPGEPFSDGTSLQEEPPPPYRPCSIPALSRDSSVRGAENNLFESRDVSEQSPFADPREDDAVSDLSGDTLRRNDDAMSAVSDMTYQEEPVVPRPQV